MRGSSRPQHEGAAGDAKGSHLGAPSATMDASAGAEGPSAEAEALAPAVTRNMGAPFHDMHEMGGSKGHRYLDPGTQAMRSHRSLRGVRRALHAAGVQHDENIFSQPLANATLAQQLATPPPPPDAQNESGKYGILLTVICFVILAPCLLAAVAQTVHCWRKRRRDRVERELLAVSTNPTSRMLVLSEIFKNDSRPVTEDDASPKKKRVQVKRHRKKTAAERQGIKREDAGNEEVSSDEDEEMGGWSGGDDQRPMIVYVSSFEHLESQHEVAGDEHSTGRSSQEQHIPDTPITQTSDNNSSDVAEDASSGSEQKIRGKDEGVAAGSAHDRVESEEKPSDAPQLPIGTEVGEDSDKGPESKTVDNDEQEPITDANSEPAPPTVLLAPKIPSTNEQEQTSSKSSPADVDTETAGAPPDIPPLAIVEASPESNMPRSLSPRPMLGDSTASPSTPLQFMPDLSDEDSDDDVAVGRADRGSIFRANSEDDNGIPGIHGCGSSVTEVTSNVEMLKDAGTGTSSFDDVKLEPLHINPTKGESAAALYPPYQLETATSTSSNGLGAPVPIKSVESFRTGTSSNVSYFSFEDVSIASDESEMCAICLCPYEEGDVRIFSKRCPHAFHKECILEWLVKSHNECPCCRIEMVTKSEIEQMSASLIGTERLAHAMAMVNGSQMTVAPPFSGVRRSQLARQIAVARARTRELRQRAGQAREPGAPASMPLESPNAHWLWASRFNDGPAESPTRSTLSPGLSPSGLNTSFNSGPTAPRTPRSSNISTRFIRSSSNSSQPRTINPTRSSDAIMNPHEANQSNVAARQRADTAPDASLHDSNAGSLITTSSMYHDHWTRRSADRRTRRRSTNQPVTLSPRRVHAHWRQTSMRANEPDELPVTVLPPM